MSKPTHTVDVYTMSGIKTYSGVTHADTEWGDTNTVILHITGEDEPKKVEGAGVCIQGFLPEGSDDE
ncbi:hypothetical protein [Halobacterium rubrum]|uniref:hypothetical protein n=1 Tax=Halobacterium TaxID=2239 RepID=UPI001F26558E|nr:MULTISPECIES: hypothetical protein [Halobacterium]MDH5021725.1 hypothetical protein [Halobacterium rubrum]